MEYDLVYLKGDLLFWGARNIDGRGFDTERNRPTNLQIPLIRKYLGACEPQWAGEHGHDQVHR